MANTTMRHNPFNTYRKIMIGLSWIVAILLFTFFFKWVLHEQENPNQHPTTFINNAGQQEVVLERNRWHAYIVSGKINDTEVTFLVDTGATQVSVPEYIAKQIGLKPGYPMQATTANGQVTVYQTTISRLQLGDIVLHNVSANINPGMKNKSVLLGMSALKQLEVFQRGNIMVLRK